MVWPDPGGGMKWRRRRKGKAVRTQVVVQWINRKLAAKGQILMATRKMNMTRHLGDYYILDLSGNVMDTHIDPEKLARKLGVLKEGEGSGVEKTRSKS
jgi:hypothetical protein